MCYYRLLPRGGVRRLVANSATDESEGRVRHYTNSENGKQIYRKTDRNEIVCRPRPRRAHTRSPVLAPGMRVVPLLPDDAHIGCRYEYRDLRPPPNRAASNNPSINLNHRKTDRNPLTIMRRPQWKSQYRASRKGPIPFPSFL